MGMGEQLAKKTITPKQEAWGCLYAETGSLYAKNKAVSMKISA
jgi:hypothetical protein